MEPKYIRIRGARMHNLKNIKADLPRNKLVLLTGLSGSGKSTLAFDTLYAEGQRRYVESLSTYARQFLGQMDKPDVDVLEGLSPAVSIEQRTTSRNPRSTVGTITEIYDHLRLLYARAGRPHCPDCGKKIQSGEHRELLENLRKEGFVRVRINHEIHSLDEEIKLSKNKRHTIEAVVDRLVIKPKTEQRLADSASTAVKLSNGFLLASFPAENQEILFSEKAACIECGRSLPDLTTQLFSFNNPKGACSECSGLGVKQFFDPKLVVPNPSLSLSQGALAPWGYRSLDSYIGQMITALAGHYKFSVQTPFHKLSSKAQEVVLYGTGREEIIFRYQKDRRRLTAQTAFEGILPQMARRYRETTSARVREELTEFMNEQPCPTCHGARLRPEALAVRIGSWNIYEMTLMSIERLLAELPAISFSDREKKIAGPVIKEIMDRLSFLKDVGLGYLALARQAGTLSGGEAQRIRLASQIGSRLAGVLYILDEPSIGLHQRDNQRLINTLASLRDLGNTVIVVEHDAETILAADHVLDMGPGAGRQGGEIVYSGSVPGLLKHKTSQTGKYLSGRLTIPVPDKRRKVKKGKTATIKIKKATANNLKKVNVAIPLGIMSCVTGVSGSGKSSLIIETLYKGAVQHVRSSGSKTLGASYDTIEGLGNIDKVIDIDQGPIGRTPRSNPATYTGILTPIRELLSRLPESRARGYKLGRFSFNLKGGRCEACEGDGVIKIAMHFLPDIYITCDTCKGRRYNRETLQIKYRSRNIADILSMTVQEALEFFTNIPPIKNRLQTLADVGLSYISLGQSSVTLSGGEAQRIKLARELAKRATGSTLYILDEPTTGLHPADIRHLLNVLGRLVDSGNTVVVIEHNLDVIKAADHIIDLGPEGGEEGGRVIATGPPEQVAENKNSYTGAFLKHVL
jgi:excinuclease ABC subunit A